MTWQGIHGHDTVAERFRQSIAAGRLASTFLFVGPRGVGKATFARKLTQALLCQTNPPVEMNPCGECANCRLVAAGTHPDVHEVHMPEDKNNIPLGMLIGDDKHPREESLCHKIATKPTAGPRKVAIVHDADHFNREGANCLLKTLEEPPPGSVLILIGTSPQRQLSTIRSRSQIVRFAPLAEETVAQLLLERELAASTDEARQMAALAEGSLARACELADADLREFREYLLGQLAASDGCGLELAKAIGQFADAAGKESALKRARCRQAMEIAAEFYRTLMRHWLGTPTETDALLAQALRRSETWWTGDEETAADCLDRCLEAIRQVDANANQATLLECWIDDLRRLSHGQMLAG